MAPRLTNPTAPPLSEKTPATTLLQIWPQLHNVRPRSSQLLPDFAEYDLWGCRHSIPNRATPPPTLEPSSPGMVDSRCTEHVEALLAASRILEEFI